MAYKVCPICEAHNHRNAALCSTCGTTLAQVEPQTSADAHPAAQHYDFRYGESDLFEGSVKRTGRIFTFILVLAGILLAIGIAIAVLAPSLSSPPPAAPPTASPTRASLPTVTQGIPTLTRTPTTTPSLTPSATFTPAPCVQQVAAGDTLIAILARCGYRTLDIQPTVLALNGIADETRLQLGQEIVVPLPSPTLDPNATAAPAESADGSSNGSAAGLDGIALLDFVDPFAPTATATLLPGVMWHFVEPDENMIVIALKYDTNAKVLSDLNPEIDFARCDFGMDYGGPGCIVHLFQGQQMRVPEPTPLVSSESQSAGSLPTPVPLPDFNAPHAISPPNQAFFGSEEQVTLRWVATGTLAADESYRIAVSDVGSGTAFTAETRDLFYILPLEWQAKDALRHHYIWQVSIVNAATDSVLFSTDARSFVWEGAGI